MALLVQFQPVKRMANDISPVMFEQYLDASYLCNYFKLIFIR